MKVDPRTIRYWKRVWEGFKTLLVIGGFILAIIAGSILIFLSCYGVVCFLSLFFSKMVIMSVVFGTLAILWFIDLCYKLGREIGEE